jgi:glutathione peroxidase-family protein
MKSFFGIFLLLMVTTLQAFTPAPKSVYDYYVEDIAGTTVSLKDYKGKVLMIVNVANKCKMAYQYKELQEIFDKYSAQGFTVLAFPSSTFSPEDKDAKAFSGACVAKYAITFPIFSNVDVKGDDTHPLYMFLSNKNNNGKLDAPVEMNFQKFLVGKDGQLLETFSYKTAANSKKITKAIEKALAIK